MKEMRAQVLRIVSFVCVRWGMKKNRLDFSNEMKTMKQITQHFNISIY